MAIKFLDENPNFVEDTDKGIIIPATMGRSGFVPHPFDNPNGGILQRKGVVSYDKDKGVSLKHDPDTGIAFWPSYASGLDDFLMRAIVQGYMANGSQTPVPMTLVSALVSKLQNMTATWVTTVTGKSTPVKRFLDILARAQGSQFGPSQFIQYYIGAMLVENRGAIGAQVPIGIIALDDWESYGMMLQQIEDDPKYKGKREPRFVLRMTPESFRENQGIWMLDGLTCLPTGNAEYPYWIRKWSTESKGSAWVLIHRDFGFQIPNIAGPKNDLYPGWGQSPVWRISEYIIKSMAIDRMDWEALIAQPPRGIVWVSGLDTPTQFRDQLIKYQEDRQKNNIQYYSGVFFGGSRNEKAQITMIPWTEPPAGYTPSAWSSEVVSKIAAAFHVNEAHLQLKLGEGAMTQSGIADALEAETAISHFRALIEMVWNHIAPPRVMVTVVWRSDRTKAKQIETASNLSLTLERLTKANAGVPVFTAEEVRALFTTQIGIEIPETEAGDIVKTDSSTSRDVSQSYTPHNGLVAGNSYEYDGTLVNVVEKVRVGGSEYAIFMKDGRAGVGEAKHFKINKISMEFEPLSGQELDDVNEIVLDRNDIESAAIAIVNSAKANVPQDLDGEDYELFARELIIEEGAKESEDSTASLLEMAIALYLWELAQRRQISYTHTAQYMLGANIESLSQDDWDIIGILLLSQFSFLRNFVNDIASGNMTEAQIRARIDQYYSSSVSAYSTGTASQFDHEFALMLPVQPGDCSSECCAYDKCFWRVTQDGEIISAEWVRTTGESCPTCIRRQLCPPITFNKENGQVENMECYR